jgi:hypothetical protein
MSLLYTKEVITMAKKCIMMEKITRTDGVICRQDCLTGFTVIEKVVNKRQTVFPTITSTEPVTEPVIEIPGFFLKWQERRDSLSKVFSNAK